MFLRCSICAFLAATALFAQNRRGGVQAPPATDCAASGTVVNALTGEPIPRAMVSLPGANVGAATDAEGKWSVTNATCGNTFAQAQKEGFAPATQTRALAASRQGMIQLVSGSPVNDVKLLLMPSGSISGSVRDTDGEPVAPAQVRLMRVNVQAGRRVLSNQGLTSTDLDGNFRINLTPGRYVVCADSSRITYPVGGGEAMVYREACFPGPVESGLSNAMLVEAGQEVRTAFTLTATRGVRVRGSISGAPAPPDGPSRATLANVQLLRLGGGGGKGGRVMRDGTFEFDSVQPGSYILRATFPGEGQPGAAPSAQVKIEVGDRDLDNIVLAYEAPGTIAGSVRYELSQTGPSAGTKPPVNVQLMQGAPGTVFFGPIPQAQWDADHMNFTFPGVAPGEYRLNANVNGPGIYVKSGTLHGQDVVNRAFAVDGSAGPIDIVVSDDTGSLDAMVNDADGEPAASSILLLSASGQHRILSSGDDGHGSAKNVPAGDYLAWAFDNINSVPYEEEEWLAQNTGTAEKVTVTAAGSASVTLRRMAAPAE